MVENSESEKKIAQSTGNDLDKYANNLEDEADQLIKQIYYPEDKEKEEDTKKAKQDKDDEIKLDSEDVNKKEDDETAKKETELEAERLEAEKQKEKQEILEAEEGEDFESFKQKAEKRIKDNQAQATRKAQEASQYKKELEASTTLIKALQQTVESLQAQLKDDSKKTNKEEEGKEPETQTVNVELDDINKQIEEINKIDPDLAMPIENVIKKLVNKIDSLNTQLINKTKSDEEAALKEIEDLHYAIIEEAHPDWATISESQEFHDWIEQLPPRERRVAKLDLEEGTAEDIVELLSDYKKSTGLIKDENNLTKVNDKLEKARQLSNPSFNRSKTINIGERVKYTRSQIQKMSPEEFAEKEKDIEKEMAAGRIGMY